MVKLAQSPIRAASDPHAPLRLTENLRWWACRFGRRLRLRGEVLMIAVWVGAVGSGRRSLKLWNLTTRELETLP